MTFLDTDIFSLLVTGHARVAERFQCEAPRYRVDPCIADRDPPGSFCGTGQSGGQRTTPAERSNGFEQSGRDLAKIAIVRFNPAAAAQFDLLRRNKKLKKIGRGDLLIASIALAHRATLATRNVRDFRQVPGLRVENWAD